MELAALADERTNKRKFADEGNVKKFKSLKMSCRHHFGTSQGNREASVHPKVFLGMCMFYGQNVEDIVADVSFKQFYEHMIFGTSDTTGLLRLYFNHWMKAKRPKLVLDLDHTLINSSDLEDLVGDEVYLLDHVSTTKGLLHRIDFEDCSMLVKIRPFVRQFLNEANNMFDLYVYTMGTRDYATEMVKLLDPENKYFASKVISRSDCMQSGVKALDIVPGSKACTIILDDNLSVWKEEDRKNIIEIWKYNFFASSCRGSHSRFKPLAQMRIDERESDGTLASILSVLKHAYWRFLHADKKQSGLQPDFRIILKEMRSEILRGCVVGFAGVPPSLSQGWMPLRQVVQQLGAKCCRVGDASATHVLAVHCSTPVGQWALKNGKFLVHTDWLEAARYLWCRPQEGEHMLLPFYCNPAALPAPTPSPAAAPTLP